MTSRTFQENSNCQACDHWLPEAAQCSIIQPYDKTAGWPPMMEKASDQCVFFKPKGKADSGNDFPFI